MFGFDKMFDLNGDGKLDTFEKAVRMEFLYESEKEESRRKKGRLDLDYDSDHYDDDDRYGSRWDED